MMAAARRVPFADVQGLRTGHRAEAECQIVRDSILPRGLAQPYLLELQGEVVGYAGVWTEHFPGRVMEFYLVPDARDHLDTLCRALLDESDAVQIEAQTNLPLLHVMIRRFAGTPWVENILFEERPDPREAFLLPPPGVRFRARRDGEEGPSGDWVLVRESDDLVVGGGGFLRHYNPPYCDLFMEVRSDQRRRGYGSYLVQELRRVAREAGLIAAARCDPANRASRLALRRGGMRECGEIVAGLVLDASRWK